ncbi:MAG: acetylxylan esterase, partial [Acidobacteriota bacterium]
MSNRTRLTPPRWTARRLVLIALCVLAGIAVLHQPESASTQERVLTPLNRFPRMVQEFFVDQVRRVETEADQRRQALATKEDAERYVKEVRKKIQDSFGPWPAKTPLNPRITGVVERDSFKIEKVIFESRPNFLVTANLYIPTGREFPLPGVVGTCGHSSNGKAEGAYQSFAQGLVRQGYVVLLYDPIGQGERLQYPDDELKSEIGVGVREHLYGGNQQFLVGEFFGAWRAWDGIRALDYLLTRPEVDPDRVGVTGNSGGGTMTTWLAGLDNRWAMAAPSCFVTTFRRNLENELPADTEQCPPRALALGLDHSDWLAAMAPRPTIILAKERDYFDARGAETSYWRLRKLYSLLGAEQNVGLFIGPTTHGYSQENREAMYRWFNQTNSISESGQEPALVMEEDETLQCTPEGQVSQMGSRPIFEFTRDQSRQLAEQRPLDLDRDGLQKRVRRMLSIPETMDSGPDYRILREWSPRNYPKPRWSAYMIETEPGISALVYRLGEERHLSRPHGDSKRAVLYVSHLSSDAELREEPLLTELIGEEPD